MVSPSNTKPTAHDYGVEGARRRWGPHGRILRLDQLDPITKNIVLAILDAQASAKNATPTPENGAPQA
jgi:hypothetical protein